MQFRVPKYLERESTIAFGLTFKKLAIAGGAGLLLFVLRYILPMAVWIGLVVITVGAFFVFNFIKIKGQSVFESISRSFGFFFSTRTYIWQKEHTFKPIQVVKKKKEKQEQTSLKVAPKSSLRKIRSKIDLGM